MSDQQPVSEIQKRIHRLAELLADHPDPAVAEALADLVRLTPVFPPRRAFVMPPKQPTKEEAEARARAIAEAQGTLGKSTVENLLGKGKNLWDSDDDLEQFLAGIRARKQHCDCDCHKDKE